MSSAAVRIGTLRVTRILMDGCFGLNSPLRQYFSLYWAFSHREGERRESIDERKHVQTTPPTPTASTAGPCATIIHISKTPRRWKFIQHHCTTRPPPREFGANSFKSKLLLQGPHHLGKKTGSPMGVLFCKHGA